MLISTAYAQGTGMLDQNTLIQFLPLVLIFVVFYFLLIRPQQKRAKEHKTMLSTLRRGDRVVTGGGIIGTVAKSGRAQIIAEMPMLANGPYPARKCSRNWIRQSWQARPVPRFARVFWESARSVGRRWPG